RAARRDMGAELTEVTISGTYACRTRNFRVGGRLSEHAAGNAVDLTAFTFDDGRRAALPQDWRRGAEGAFLLSAWRAACGPFGTVLGPEHDQAHEDHFHFDTASRSRGPICR
ncbi:MAG: extensin family protein, partial [Pseudomonadota bacterium]